MKKFIMAIVFFLCIGIFSVYAASELKPYIDSVKQAESGMTLWQTVKSGGVVMLLLGLLSIVAMAFIAYNFITLKVNRLTPRLFAEEVIQNLEARKDKAVMSMCHAEDNIIARLVAAGLEKRKRGFVFAKEAMESCAKNEIENLWQNVTYLSDIATIAPLIGLLGTVLGMIQAFNVIAFQSAVVKPMLLAGGVSKAMVTTAGGLIVAIPAMLFFTYFRGKVRSISGALETYTTDIIKVIEEL